MGVTRRAFGKALLTLGGAVVCGGVASAWADSRPVRLPLAGYAAAADVPSLERAGQLSVTWYVQTTEPLAAFTFDDGPGPRWTSMVLDVLDDHQVPATFFMVGERLAAHAGLVAHRLGRHEVGNHSWSHPDFGELDVSVIRDQIGRTHETIRRLTGQRPRLLRPPYGHVGGSTLLAADDFGYQIVLWSIKMHERSYLHDPQGQVRDIVDHVGPGSIVLAHDVGGPERLVALSHLDQMITGLRQRGLRFVTVSELLAAARPAATGPQPSH